MRTTLLIALLSFNALCFGQSVPFPSSFVYDEISPWGYEDVKTNWDTSPYLPFIFQNNDFRLLPPNEVSYDSENNTWSFDPEKKYPLVMHFIGAGNRGNSNNVQLNNAGLSHRDAVLSDEFPGWAFFPSYNSANNARVILEKLIEELPIDPNRIYVHGTSNGGKFTHEWAINNPDLTSAYWPMSGTVNGSDEQYSKLIYTPTRHSQGEKDGNPSPGFTGAEIAQLIDQGAGYVDYRYYPDLGHNTWGPTKVYNEEDFFTWFLDQANNRVYAKDAYHRICPGDPIVATLGVNPGHEDYEWRKDGVLIAGANNYELEVTEFGTYDARIKILGAWTDYGIPLEVFERQPTQTPPIELENSTDSRYLPDANNSSTVPIKLPDGYILYEWYKDGQLISTSNIINAATVGDYTALVAEDGGCSSLLSEVFTIYDVNGPNKPDNLYAVSGIVLSKTELELSWAQENNPIINEVGFEVFRRKSEEGEYDLVMILPADEEGFVDSDLEAGTEYEYVVRPIGQESAADFTETVKLTTESDIIPPSAPTDFRIVDATISSVSFQWDPSTDDVGIDRYFLYQDGNLIMTSTNTEALVYNLSASEAYEFYVVSVDQSGNPSPESNRLVVFNSYSTGAEANLKFNGSLGDDSPNGTSSTGVVSFDESDFIEGSASIYFNGNSVVDFDSDDLFIHNEFNQRSIAFWFKSTQSNGTQDIFDEGGATNGIGIRLVDQTIQLAVQDNHDIFSIEAPIFRNQWHHVAGVYNGGVLQLYLDGVLVNERSDISFDDLVVSAHSDASGIGGTNGSNAFDVVSDRFEGFMDDFYLFGYALSESDVIKLASLSEDVLPDETILKPSGLIATAVSYDGIDLSWTDNSDNEVGFQIYRSEEGGELIPIAITDANVTQYEDRGNLSPATTYTYGIIALGQYSESIMEGGVVSSDAMLIQLPLDGDLVDISGKGVNNVAVSSPIYSTTDFNEGTASLQFPGNSYVDLDVDNQFIHNRFTERTISLWLKASDLSGLQDFFDEGGATNGIGLRINNGLVELAVQDNHEIHMVSGAITVDTWHHVAGIYDAGILSLYLDGSLADEVTGIAYSGLEVSDHGNGSGLGATNGSNAFDQVNNNFDGLIDDVRIFSTALDVSGVLSLINGDVNQATTLAFPTAPNAPIITSAVSISPTENTITWISSDQDGFEVFRSINTSEDFLPLTYIEDNTDGTHSITDGQLQGHTTYYYKIQAYNAGGLSDFSSISSVTTLNNDPVLLESVNDIFMHYESMRDLTFTVTDGDGDIVSFSSNNLPSFAVLTDNGDNTASLSIDPDVSDNGNLYPDIELVIDDGFGGMITEIFSITVNDNYSPEVASYSPVTVTSGESTTLTLTATDQNGDAMTWAVISVLPDFITHGTTSGSTFDLTISPVDVNDVGDYSLELSVADDQTPAGITYLTVPVTVESASAVEEIWVNFTGNRNGSSPWNNFQALRPVSGAVLSDLQNDSGSPTGVDLTLDSNWGGVGNYGGMPTGHYESNVRESYFWTDNGSETIILSGLDLDRTYGFDFYASRNSTGLRTTIFTVGGVSQSIQAALNSEVLIHFDPISPDGSGEIEITIDHPVGNIAYLNAMVVTSEALSVPISPTSLSVEAVTGNVELNWEDNSNNETGFEVYASEGDNTSYLLVETVVGSSYTYTPTSQSDVYFRVRAVNGVGASGYTNEVFFEYVNLAPQLASISDAELSYEGTLVVDVFYSDPEGDVVTISVDGASTFSSYQDTGVGTGQITFTPTQDEIGTHLITVTATDTEGNESSTSFALTVINPSLETVLLNFTSNASTVGAPWNNLIGAPIVGHSLSNLTTTESVSSGITVTLLDSWFGAWDFGATTGNNTGVYPDAALVSYYADNSAVIHRIEFSGLNPAKVYDFTMFASRGAIQDTRITTYEIGSSSATLNVTNNVSEVAKINGIEPDATGTIVLEVSKGVYSWKYINAMEISYYDAPLTPGKPSDLAANPLSRDGISLSWTDNSSNEDGFEIERGIDGGTWAQIATVGPDVTNYDDSGLAENTTYSYRVRAYNTNGTSSYTEVVEETTYDYFIYLNIGGEDFIAPSPWNNMGQEPFIGVTSTSLKDDLGQQTSIQMEITENFLFTSFDAAGSIGMNTGNDSGVVPDIVMQSYYWLVQLDLGTFKFNNLLLNQEYDVVFFASRAADFRTTVFSIGEESVTLNASFNTTETVEIRNVRPDVNGEIHVGVQSVSGGHLGYINAVILKASNASTANNVSESASSRVAGLRDAEEDTTLTEEVVVDEITPYPNPFTEVLNLRIVSKEEKDVEIILYDLNGAALYQIGTHFRAGLNDVSIPTRDLVAGTFLLKVASEGKIETMQLIRE